MFKQTNMKKILGVFIALVAVVMLASCGTKQKELTIGEGDWDSNQVHDQIAKYIIENGYDVKVNIVLADTALLLSALKSNNVDVSLELWTDNIPSYDSDLEAGHYEEVSTNFADNKQGLYIPKYLQEQYPDLVSVEDLKRYSHLFDDPNGSGDQVIYGGPEGWAATEFMYQKVELYGLDEFYNFKTIDSNAILSATLKAAYDNELPWVGYNWEPTWIMGIYDMVLLEDSAYSEEDYAVGRGAFPSVDVTVVVRDGFKKDFPELYDFFSNYQTSTEITNKALAYMQENDVEAYEAAIWFLETYEDLWGTWVPEDVKTKVLDSLNK